MKKLIVTLALLYAGSASAATDLPTYDSAAFCKTMSSMIVVSEDYTKQAFEGCMKKEQQAPAQIARLLPFADKKSADGCAVSSKAYMGGSYQGFAGCLLMTIMPAILDGKITLSFAK